MSPVPLPMGCAVTATVATTAPRADASALTSPPPIARDLRCKGHLQDARGGDWIHHPPPDGPMLTAGRQTVPEGTIRACGGIAVVLRVAASRPASLCPVAVRWGRGRVALPGGGDLGGHLRLLGLLLLDFLLSILVSHHSTSRDAHHLS